MSSSTIILTVMSLCFFQDFFPLNVLFYPSDHGGHHEQECYELRPHESLDEIHDLDEQLVTAR